MANQSIYAAFERMWQHLSDRLEEYKPEGLATEEYVDSKVANKVDKVNGKGLSDVNFTKEYEAQINTNKINISSIDMRCEELEDITISCSAAAARATEIITNPYGAYLNSQILVDEVLKLELGESSDKLFVQGSTFFIKLSDKIPSNEEMAKGFTLILSMVGLPTHGNYPSWSPSLLPLMYVHVGDIRDDDQGWSFVHSNSESFEGGQKFLNGLVVMIGDSDNEYGLPVGIYTTMDMSNSPGIMCSGLQINGFNLNSSTAPVSQEQLGDISSILDSIIGEEVWTFTLEDGSTVDKVVISSD